MILCKTGIILSESVLIKKQKSREQTGTYVKLIQISIDWITIHRNVFKHFAKITSDFSFCYKKIKTIGD